MLEQGLSFYIIIFLLCVLLLIASFAIPIWGYISKRRKGLALGCLVQPFASALLIAAIVVGCYFYQRREFKMLRKAAMVSVSTIENEDTLIWHLKPDEECFFERHEKGSDVEALLFDNVNFFDVVALDSTAVEVDDVIKVSFDIAGRKVKATRYDQPMAVVGTDWEKVESFFQERR